MTTPITRAVILAAGTGSRLSVDGDSCPKPLRAVRGKPLLVRVLNTLRAEGVTEAVIVTGFQGDRIRRTLNDALRKEGIKLELLFVDNPDYLKKNGVSLLSAAPFVDRECYLSMSDHLYSRKLVRRLSKAALPAGACGLGVDYDIPRCFDLDDATKVRVQDGLIVDIAKELPAYDALDTGVFRIGPSLIGELRRVQAREGDCSLSQGVKALSERGMFWACDVGNARWIDVDTPEASIEADRLLRAYGDDLSGIGWLQRPSGGWMERPGIPSNGASNSVGVFAQMRSALTAAGALLRRREVPMPSDAQ
ncbi:MAG TPA: NTP transferase domain-containing protein [Polyangiaceae bacterium]|nr:NTP transferase domain-containing protein [Polyangiaceae bacterium]